MLWKVLEINRQADKVSERVCNIVQGEQQLCKDSLLENDKILAVFCHMCTFDLSSYFLW